MSPPSDYRDSDFGTLVAQRTQSPEDRAKLVRRPREILKEGHDLSRHWRQIEAFKAHVNGTYERDPEMRKEYLRIPTEREGRQRTGAERRFVRPPYR